MAVRLDLVADDIPEDADYAIYRVARDEAIVLTRRLEWGWTRDARLQILLLWHLVDGIQANNKSVWDIDNRCFIAGTEPQKSFVPDPKPVIVESKPDPKNRHLIKRNWAMWRMRNEQGMPFTQIAREFNITSARVRSIVISCDRRIRNAVLFKDDPEGFDRVGIRDALIGVEIVCKQGEMPHLMFENERRLNFY